jgi:hypothetical protein
MPTIARELMRTLAAPGAAAALLALAGCTSVIYDSNPEAPASQLEEEPDFASYTVQNLLATCIRWAAEQSPPPQDENDGWFAVNLPPGLTREQYIEVARQIGENAAPLTPELEYLPTYHIGWVWMRGDHARVDVFRPVFALSTGGETVYQAVTLHMKRRWASWRVERTQPWEPGVVALPAAYYLPPEEPAAGAAPAGEIAEPEADEVAEPEPHEQGAEPPMPAESGEGQPGEQVEQEQPEGGEPAAEDDGRG